MTDDSGHGPWDPVGELERDRRFELGLLWKELAVLALLAVLVLLRVMFVR